MTIPIMMIIMITMPMTIMIMMIVMQPLLMMMILMEMLLMMMMMMMMMMMRMMMMLMMMLSFHNVLLIVLRWMCLTSVPLSCRNIDTCQASAYVPHLPLPASTSRHHLRTIPALTRIKKISLAIHESLLAFRYISSSEISGWAIKAIYSWLSQAEAKKIPNMIA